MSIAAIVRVTVNNVSQVKELVPKIDRIAGVKSAKAVLGQCHIIARVETRDVGTLGKVILKLRKTSPVIVNTETNIVFFAVQHAQE